MQSLDESWNSISAGTPAARPSLDEAWDQIGTSPDVETPGRQIGGQPPVVSYARTYLGTPYKYGGTKASTGIDCSYLNQSAYRQAGIKLPRTAAAQYKATQPVDKAEAQPGDLVFLQNTGGEQGITHTGVYIGNGKWIHASAGRARRVIEDRLDTPYNRQHFAGIGRVGGKSTTPKTPSSLDASWSHVPTAKAKAPVSSIPGVPPAGVMGPGMVSASPGVRLLAGTPQEIAASTATATKNAAYTKQVKANRKRFAAIPDTRQIQIQRLMDDIWVRQKNHQPTDALQHFVSALTPTEKEYALNWVQGGKEFAEPGTREQFIGLGMMMFPVGGLAGKAIQKIAASKKLGPLSQAMVKAVGAYQKAKAIPGPIGAAVRTVGASARGAEAMTEFTAAIEAPGLAQHPVETLKEMAVTLPQAAKMGAVLGAGGHVIGEVVGRGVKARRPVEPAILPIEAPTPRGPGEAVTGAVTAAFKESARGGRMPARAGRMAETTPPPPELGTVPVGAKPAGVEGAPIANAANFREAWVNTGKFTPEHAEAMTALAEANRAYLGMNEATYYPKLWQSVESGGVPGEGALMQEMVPTFYSKLERTVQEKMGGKAMPDQLRKTLEAAGVKPEEMKYTGFDAWLTDQQGKPITKQAALDFLKENQVQVQEVMKGDMVSDADFGKWYDETFPSDYQKFDQMTPEVQAQLKRQYGDSPHPTKFQQYVLPGGENYRELLLTLPDTRRPLTFEEWYANRGESLPFDQMSPDIRKLVKRAYDVQVAENQLRTVGPEPYGSPHWDEPNVVAHVRFNDRTGPNGEKILHVEEVQSDWHQAGRTKGYAEDTGKWAVRYANGDLYQTLGSQAEATKMADAMNTDPALGWVNSRVGKFRVEPYKTLGVPPAPFSKTWHELAMKRVLRYAAENGYDKVTWTTGEMQAARYDLSKQVSKIEYQLRGQDDPNVPQLRAYNLDGEMVVNKGVPESQLPDFIGKEAAQKLLDAPEAYSGVRRLEGLDLKVGGEGMKGFYDKILPDTANKLVKRHGGRVGETTLDLGNDLEAPYSYEGPTPTAARLREIIHDPNEGSIIKRQAGEALRMIEMDGTDPAWAVERAGSPALAELLGGRIKDLPRKMQSVHSLDLTPSLKSSVLTEGQPLFQPNKGSVEFTQQGAAIVRAFQAADVSTGVHEMAHVFRQYLKPEDLTAVEQAYGVKNGAWERAHEERFATGFERYLRSGKAPTPTLARVFEQFKTWLTTIYQRVKGTPIEQRMPAEAKAVYDRMLGGEAQATMPTEAVQRGVEVPVGMKTPTGAVEQPGGGPEIGVSKARVAATRQATGLPPVEEPSTFRGRDASWEAGKARVDAGEDIQGLARAVIENAEEAPRALAPEDIGAFKYRLDQINSSLKNAMPDQVRALLDMQNDVHQALRLGSRGWSELGHAYQLANTADEFELGNVYQTVRDNWGGKLTDKQITDLRKKVESYETVNARWQAEKTRMEADYQKQLAAVEAKRELAETKTGRPVGRIARTVDDLRRLSRETSKNTIITDAIKDAALQRLAARGQNIAHAGIDPVGVADAALVIGWYAERGARISYAAMHELLSGYGLSDADIREAWSCQMDPKRITNFMKRAGKTMPEIQQAIRDRKPLMQKPPPVNWTPEAMKVRVELQQARDTLRRALEPRWSVRQARRLAVQLASMPTGWQAAWDNSALMLQGWSMLFHRPRSWGRGVAASYRAMFSEPAALLMNDAIEGNAKFPFAQRSGLEHTSMERNVRTVGKAEESVARMRTAEDIPILGKLLRPFDRAFTIAANVMRHDAFYRMMDAVGDRWTPEQYKRYASLLNKLTLRGDLGRAKAFGDELNAFFISPRAVAAVWQLPMELLQGSPANRLQAAQAIVTSTAATQVLAALINRSGVATVGMNPFDSKTYMQARIGDTRFSLVPGPIRSAVVTAAKIGATVWNQGPWRKEDPKFGARDVPDIIATYVGRKAPGGTQLVKSLWTGKDIMGQPVSPKEAVLNSIILPWNAQDIIDAWRSQGPSMAVAAAIAGHLGVPVQTYEDRPKKSKGTLGPKNESGLGGDLGGSLGGTLGGGLR
jgi:hypothetical protein